MARLNIAPTKSNFLSMKRQLAFAEEGYDLLEQKRQILIFEMMSRLARANELERKVAESLRHANAALREATLDIGSAALDRAALGVKLDSELKLTGQRLMGLTIPRVTFRADPPSVPFGVVGTSANTDAAQRRFVALLLLLAELAELQNAVLRLARELRKTQRRCNALSKIFIPSYRETITYISGTLEERERESLNILKIIRDRLAQPFETAAASGNATSSTG
jgi:V/A-type H+-transporting ATPase subunit D